MTGLNVANTYYKFVDNFLLPFPRNVGMQVFPVVLMTCRVLNSGSFKILNIFERVQVLMLNLLSILMQSLS